jgi:hypothetical protein
VEMVKSLPNVFGIAFREGWTANPARQAANLPEKGNNLGL